MSALNHINLTLKLDRAYEHGDIAFLSAKPFLVPIRDRRDIQATDDGQLLARFRNGWLEARPDQIKFCRRH